MMKMYSLKINIFGNRQRACLLIFLGVFHFSTLFAQTDLKVGTSPGLLSTSAVFEAASTTKGALIPRMTTAQMNAIASPALGLLVFNTDANCLYFYVSGWKSQCDPANLGAWSLLGNADISSSNFLGSTNNAPLRFRTNNVERMILDSIGRVGIGTGSPLTPLHLYTDVSNNAFRISNSTNTGRTMSAFVENNGYSEINTAGSDLGIKAGYRLNLIGQGGAWGNVFSFAQTTATTHNNGTSFLRFDGNYAPSTAPTTVGDYRFFDINPIINQTGAANLDYSILDMNVTETSVLGANKYLAHWRTNGLSRFSVTSAGNVGIGTAAPKSQLDVYATSGGETRLSSNNTTKYGEIIFSSNNSGYLDRGASIEGNGNNVGLDVGQLIFKTQYGSSPRTERMRINSNGLVGINTATPSYRLDIDANTGGTGNPLRLQGLQAGATTDSLLTSASGVVRRLAINQLGNGNFWKIGGNTEGGVRNLGTTDNYGLPFLTNNVERMRITETGSVGIGTSSPGLLLHVAASSGSQQGIYLSDGSNTDLRIYRDADVGNWSLLRSDVGNGIGIIGLPDIMSISVPRNTGNVGISTSTPQAKLDVNGKIISGSAAATGGSVILEGLYNQSTGAGALNILGASYSSGGTVLSYGGVPSASLRDSFTSSTNVALPRAAMILDGDINFLNATSQTLAIGTPISISSKMIIKTNGRVGIGTNAPSRKLELSVGDQDGIKVVSTGSARMDFTTAGGGGVIYSNNIGHYFQDDIGTNRVAILATGNTGIGVTTPSVKLDIDGAVAVRANAMNVTADNQAVTVGNRSYLKLTADGAPTSRTVTLSNGASEGQILIISVIGTGANGIELADSGNLNLSGTAQLDNGDTIQLIWDGTSWNEITRSYN